MSQLATTKNSSGGQTDFKLLAGWQSQQRHVASSNVLRKPPESNDKRSWITKLREADENAGIIPWTEMMWVKVEDEKEAENAPGVLEIIPDESDMPSGPGTVQIDEKLKAEIELDAESKQQEEEFPLYAMKYKPMGFPLSLPKLRIICFHNAGSTESNYTAANTPFTIWAKEATDVEIVALDYPGRNKMTNRTPHKSISTLAPDLLAAIFELVSDGTPYITWAHSVGTWVSFELLMLARKMNLPMPVAAFFNAFPAPHMPEKFRPWSKTARMTEKRMKQEVTNWDSEHFTGAGQVVFDEPDWKDTWGPLLRADFKLFDQYKFDHAGAPRFEFPIHAWHCEGENYCKPEMVKLWGDWTSGEFEFETLKKMGHLTCFYKSDYKKEYFSRMTKKFEAYHERLD